MLNPNVTNYIESQHRLLHDKLNIEFLNLYQAFSNSKLRNIFSTIQHLFVVNYSAMNERLPSGDIEQHFWAENSRELILAIEVLEGLERVLKTTEEGFSVDPYYKNVIAESKKFLVKSGGSKIPPHTEKIVIYYTEPILRKIDSIEKSTADKVYMDLKQIGSGSYATVYTFTDPFYNRKYVLKRANSDLDAKELERFKLEYEQMSMLSSPYIAEVFSYNEAKHEYIMEYMDYTLQDYIKVQNPSRNERRKLVFQLFQAFKYIHSKGIFHRDISTVNVMIKHYEDVNIIKVCDFGLVKIKNSHLTSTGSELKGSLNDQALEIQGFSTYSIIHETYALTRLISFVMTGQTYIDEDTDPKLREFVEKGTNALPKQRFQSVDEMERTFSRIR